MAPICCTNCGGSSFYVRDAVHVCLLCQVESQEHGKKTELDQESLGVFGSAASTIKTKSIYDGTHSSRGGSSRSSSCGGDLFGAETDDDDDDPSQRQSISFTTIDLYTHILLAWVEKFIELELADDSLKNNAFNLWAKYLRLAKLAFVSDEEASYVGAGLKRPMRDTQVALFGQKKIITSTRIKSRRGYKQKRTLVKERIRMAKENEDGLNSDDDENVKKVRNQKRRKFLKTLDTSMNILAENEDVATRIDDKVDDRVSNWLNESKYDHENPSVSSSFMNASSLTDDDVIDTKSVDQTAKSVDSSFMEELDNILDDENIESQQSNPNATLDMLEDLERQNSAPRDTPGEELIQISEDERSMSSVNVRSTSTRSKKHSALRYEAKRRILRNTLHFNAELNEEMYKKKNGQNTFLVNDALQFPSFSQLVHILILSILATDNNELTLTDICHVINRRIIHVLEPYPLIPESHRRLDVSDTHYLFYTADCLQKPSVDFCLHIDKLYHNLAIMANTLKLGCVNFSLFTSSREAHIIRKGGGNKKYHHHLFEITLRRVLNDLSLPKGIFHFIFEKFGHFVGQSLFECVQVFRRTKPDSDLSLYQERNRREFHCVMRRVMACIVVTLKYMYIIDDLTELYLSANAQTVNRFLLKKRKNENADVPNSVSPLEFDFMSWLHLTSFKFLHIFSDRDFYFNHMFSSIPISTPTTMSNFTLLKPSSMRSIAARYTYSKSQRVSTIPNPSSMSNKWNSYVHDLKQILTQNCDSKDQSSDCQQETFLGDDWAKPINMKSTWCKSFADHLLQSSSGCSHDDGQKLTDGERECLETLSEMPSHILLNYSGSTVDTEVFKNFIKEGCTQPEVRIVREKEVKKKQVTGIFRRQTSSYTPFEFVSEQSESNSQLKRVRQHLSEIASSSDTPTHFAVFSSYWILMTCKTADQRLPLSNVHCSDFAMLFPRNFYTLMSLLSAYMGVKIVDLYQEVLFVENAMLKVNPNAFRSIWVREP